MQLETGRVLQRLKPLFDENFERFGELGAAVSVWQNGKPIVDLHSGYCDAGREKPWKTDTLVLVWYVGLVAALTAFSMLAIDPHASQT